MNYTDRKTHACYANDYLSLSFDNATAHLAFLGLDAGGRDASRKNTYNLLKPGHGAWSPIFKAAGKPAVKASPTGVSAKAGAVAQRFRFTFTTALAVTEGVVGRREGAAMLRRLLRQMKRSGFGDFRFGIPGPTIPVARPDTIDWAFMGDWPMYENGGCCGLTAYHFLNALYHAGLVAEADAILFKMLETFETKATHSGLFPGYMESVDWRTKDGVPCGYNYLADNYVFLGAAVIAKGGLPHPAIAPARDA